MYKWNEMAGNCKSKESFKKFFRMFTQIYEPRVRNDWLFSWLNQQQQHPQQQHAHPVYFSNASGYPTHVMAPPPPPFMMFPGGSPVQSSSGGGGGSRSRQQSPRESAASRSHSDRRSKSQERARSPVRRHHTAQHHSLYGEKEKGRHENFPIPFFPTDLV